ncbi:DUF4381 domain-containing protein [Rubritalea marina]|uniref:DUF4381 domain-containing protein n=1 Tax=Rubritalea marina TaxID=361055 RepID=UPI0003810347|nr:DUF4381 domain-containing protein [Rubritalea marina]
MSGKVFEADWGNESLRGLVELEFPEPVSLVPSTPGWWILCLVLIGLVLRGFWRRRQRYLRDQYRREALEQLSSIEQGLAAGDFGAVRELAPLLRATAIAAAGRDQFAGLEGDGYAVALEELSPGRVPVPVEALQQLAYAPLDTIGGMDTDSVIQALEDWIQHHQRPHD